MTIIEAIERVDSLKPNNYTQEDKIAWLSMLDGVIRTEIIDTHEGAEDVAFNGYGVDISRDTVLLAPAPYDDVYVKWLEAQIDYSNGELAKFNNSIAMYNTAYSAFERYYNRTHMPRGTSFRYF